MANEESTAKKSSKGLIIGLICLVALVAILIGVYRENKPKTYGTGDKTIEFEVINGDSKKDFTIKTNAEMLGDALKENNLIAGTDSDYGMFVTTIDDTTADSDNQEWWCFTQDGEMLNTGVDSTPIKDGDHFEAELKVGYDMGSTTSTTSSSVGSTASSASSSTSASSAQ